MAVCGETHHPEKWISDYRLQHFLDTRLNLTKVCHGLAANAAKAQ